jgi:hypothetical protein
MATVVDTMSVRLNEQLDRLESSLPTVPARVVHLQRVVATKYYERSVEFWTAVAEATGKFVETARTSGRTIVGQAKAAGSQVAGTTRTAANTVAGQTSAQGRKVADAATDETTKLLDDAIDTVEDKPGSGRRYEQWTKAELLQRARELGVEGRTGLNKRQLIAALRKAA